MNAIKEECIACPYSYYRDMDEVGSDEEYDLGCRIFELFGMCPFDYYREDKKDDAEADR